MKLPVTDPTLEAVDRAMEARQQQEKPRPYLGMSSIGNSCSRQLWYSFRFCLVASFNASTLKKFDDGHHGEDVQAERLRLVDGIELHTETHDSKQYGFSDFAGHFRGHMDGAIKGIKQDPGNWYVWEHKQCEDKKLTELENIKNKSNDIEGNALIQWNATYYGQALLYMDYSGIDKHYLTVANAGGRHTVSCVTRANPELATQLKIKARNIIVSDRPLERVSEDASWYECKWCNYSDLCHGNRVANVNCRTCLHSSADTFYGGWTCEKHGETNDSGSCNDHLFIPDLLPFAEQVDADCDGVQYKNKINDQLFWNGKGQGRYSSVELKQASPELIGDAFVDVMKKDFNAEVSA